LEKQRDERKHQLDALKKQKEDVLKMQKERKEREVKKEEEAKHQKGEVDANRMKSHAAFQKEQDRKASRVNSKTMDE
jgi:hypothetical protein